MRRTSRPARASDAALLSEIAVVILLTSLAVPGCYDLSLPEREDTGAGAGGTAGEKNHAGAGASGVPTAGDGGVSTGGSSGEPSTAGTSGQPSTAGTSGQPSTAGTSGQPSTAGTSGQPSVGGSAGGGTAGASTGGATSSGGSAGTAGDQTGGNAGETETGGSGGAPETGGSGGTGGDPGEVGDPCGNNSECRSNNCRNAICCTAGSECCDDDTDCADYEAGNLACDTLRFECYAECGSTGSEEDARCADGYHCDANDCTPDLAHSEQCDEGSDCVSGECWDLHCCQHAGLCCAADSDCPDLFDGCATDQSQTCVYSTFAFPDTGQTDCYDVTSSVATCSTIEEGQNYHGQDGHYDGPPRAYTDLADGTVRDETTGLLWTQADSAIVSFSEADTYCSELTLAGHTWRLPKRHELQTLVDYDSTEAVGIDPAFTVTTGVGEDDFIFWTGTPFAGSPSTTAWAIDFGAGTMIRLGHAGGYDPRALCVVQQEGV